jgi:hypothetical protein
MVNGGEEEPHLDFLHLPETEGRDCGEEGGEDGLGAPEEEGKSIGEAGDEVAVEGREMV